MDAANRERTVLVLTERPEDYSALMRRLGLAPQFFLSASALLTHLADNRTSGFVLEVDKVLRASSAEREHLFQLAEVFPFLRVHRDKSDQSIACLDDPGGFTDRVLAFSPRALRHALRVPVSLRGLVAPAGEATSRPVLVNILDLSFNGGFLNSDTDFGPGEDLSLRILGLTDPEPVQARIRWRRDLGGASGRHCAGVRFMDIRPSQAEELKLRYLAPPESGG